MGKRLTAMQRLSAWIDKQCNRNRLFRRLVLIWACVLITWVIVRTWIAPPEITAGTATALATVVGILATVIGFYQWHRQADEQRHQHTGRDDP